ncbi:hypothetical protein SAMN04489806_0883 [Paramicrobacterium humi]|uniref:Oxygen-dependent protoporphyrinogen oxidase n=1 Tax=Paramicrobacterium humi TaxID=640635 RepID=A0A1H4JVQ0_9MICO|nr:hypothetical protein [Microbacterium humi]SEB50217.1 hypothetical protein SAMN04489806_0883 [Microbacterium humi]
MKGKVLFVAGLATGYVLGTRAGRKRYEQIKSGWQKIWHTAPVQKQVANLEGFAMARVSEVPKALYTGAKKLASTLSSDTTPGQKLDATIATAKDTAEDVAEVSERAQAEAGGSPSSGAPNK